MSDSKFNKSYSTEFKDGVINEFLGTDISMVDICKKHDIPYNTFMSWSHRSEELRLAQNARQRRSTLRNSYTFEERKNIVEAYLRSDMKMVHFAKANGISQGSISVWVKIYNEQGPQALESKFINRNKGRKAISENLRSEITQVKLENPSFGMRKVRDFLMRFKGVKVSHKTVGKTLKEENIALVPLVRRRRRSKDKIKRFERALPMQLWQSDITSYMLTRYSQRVYLTIFMDDHSRYIVAWNLQLRQTNELVMDCLLNGIQKFGKPEEVLTDQGRQYFAWRGKSEFKKILDREGIRHVVSRSHHPQTLGKCERFWETVKNELWERSKPQELGEARERLKHFVNHYNHFRPHQGLDGMTPADRFFGVEKEIRQKLEEQMNENALRMALGELPRTPVFLVGQIGDQAISLHGENGQLVINTPNGETKSLDYEKFGHLRKEVSFGASRKQQEDEAKPQGNVYETAGQDADTSEEFMDAGESGGETARFTDRNTSDGILGGKDNETRVSNRNQRASDTNMAVVPASDIGNAGGVIEAAESERQRRDDERRKPESIEEENSRIRKSDCNAESTNIYPTRDARMSGYENTNERRDGDTNSRSGKAWTSKEKADTEESS